MHVGAGLKPALQYNAVSAMPACPRAYWCLCQPLQEPQTTSPAQAPLAPVLRRRDHPVAVQAVLLSPHADVVEQGGEPSVLHGTAYGRVCRAGDVMGAAGVPDGGVPVVLVGALHLVGERVACLGAGRLPPAHRVVPVRPNGPGVAHGYVGRIAGRRRERRRGERGRAPAVAVRRVRVGGARREARQRCRRAALGRRAGRVRAGVRLVVPAARVLRERQRRSRGRHVRTGQRRVAQRLNLHLHGMATGFVDPVPLLIDGQVGDAPAVARR